MVDREVIGRFHRVLWFAVTMLTGVLAGFLISHSVIMERDVGKKVK